MLCLGVVLSVSRFANAQPESTAEVFQISLGDASDPGHVSDDGKSCLAFAKVQSLDVTNLGETEAVGLASAGLIGAGIHSSILDGDQGSARVTANWFDSFPAPSSADIHFHVVGSGMLSFDHYGVQNTPFTTFVVITLLVDDVTTRQSTGGTFRHFWAGESRVDDGVGIDISPTLHVNAGDSINCLYEITVVGTIADGAGTITAIFGADPRTHNQSLAGNPPPTGGMQLYIDSSVPGEHIIGSSGHDYTSPTFSAPEASSLPLLLVGLCVPVLLRLRCLNR
jgi:hypothetical protein